ncbi:MAG: hypothetical protein P8N76_04900 [Pirellulaceae bacterium]|nr:hypothetical protein [Pirellulaceae bacterium]
MQRITTATMTEIFTGVRQDLVGVSATVRVRRCFLGLRLLAESATHELKRVAWLPIFELRQPVLVPVCRGSHARHALHPRWNPMRPMHSHGIAERG